MADIITLVVPIHARPACRAEVRRRLIELAARTRREPGNMCYVLHEVRDDADQFIIYEQWCDQAALDFHMEQGYLKDFLACEEGLLAKKIRGIFCREIGLGGRSEGKRNGRLRAARKA